MGLATKSNLAKDNGSINLHRAIASLQMFQMLVVISNANEL